MYLFQVNWVGGRAPLLYVIGRDVLRFLSVIPLTDLEVSTPTSQRGRLGLEGAWGKDSRPESRPFCLGWTRPATSPERRHEELSRVKVRLNSPVIEIGTEAQSKGKRIV